MSISVDGQKCPVCHGYLFDDDEIVFCPVCGAPHHKDCYSKLGHCAVQQFHGTEMEYRRPATFESERNAPRHEHGHENHESDGNHQAGEKCPNCGFALPKDARFCPNCNHPVDQKFVGGMPFISMLPSDYDPFGGVKKDEKTEGTSAEQFRNYILVNTGRYIPKFFRLNQSAKLSWNWAAFLFPEGWFFYRKIYSVGIVALVISICTSLLTLMPNVLLQQISDSVPVDYFNSYSQMVNYLLDNASKFDFFPMYMAAIGIALSIVMRVVFAMFADWFYRTDAVERIEQVKNDDEVEDMTQALRIKGGINPFLAVAAIFSVSWIANLLYSLI